MIIKMLECANKKLHKQSLHKKDQQYKQQIQNGMVTITLKLHFSVNKATSKLFIDFYL